MNAQVVLQVGMQTVRLGIVGLGSQLQQQRVDAASIQKLLLAPATFGRCCTLARDLSSIYLFFLNFSFTTRQCRVSTDARHGQTSTNPSYDQHQRGPIFHQGRYRDRPASWAWRIPAVAWSRQAAGGCLANRAFGTSGSRPGSTVQV